MSAIRVASGKGMAGFLFGAAGMFAVMYSTQAILPQLGRAFDVGPAEAGLTVSVVVLALACGAWAWGPFSDRYGRRRSIVLASTLLVAPTIGAALAPTFSLLLVFRACQGLCMPGLLTAGVPYVTEVFAPRLGGRAMGYYLTALIAGGLIGRVGVALLSAAVGWRWAIGLLAGLPLVAAVVMWRSLVDLRPTPVRGGIARQLRNRALLQATIAGSAFFFTFVGTFSYVVFRLEGPPFNLGTAAGSFVFALWFLGVLAPMTGRLADRVGWKRVVFGSLAVAAVGLLLTLPAHLPTLVLGLALVTLANWCGVTGAQLGVAAASDTDRGAASSVYYSLYYFTGALGGYLPGLAWERYGWHGVAISGWIAIALAAAVLALGARRSYG
ncbi:MAG: transporter, family, putative rane transport protein [Gaiellales bacterium]|nr:transporter, family, putative rane transport protein [Gaiellales bacterium]